MFRISLAIATSLLFVLPASAQTWNSAQQRVLDVVIDSWDAIADRDANWTDDFVHENAVVWSDQEPMPKSRAAVKQWDRLQYPYEDMLTYTVSPAAIVVEGETAVVHYYYSLLMESRDGEQNTIHGRCSDILIADGDDWTFNSWNCGDQEDSDD